ncbi:MAG: DUF1624 domain-containing protein [Candidatus Altiarchaeales archaeon]|nr:DUF1624 domain-containing protein [Candidatus Altiarchaeales archaeon]MBD3416261.1 DUF1624 domain-containing protein [Candidatus Altiarchaeales archaeon]
MGGGSRDRILLVDSLRGLAVLLMLVHFLGDGSVSPLLSQGACGLSCAYSLLVSRLAAPLFFTVAGYSLYLSGRKRIPSSGKTGFLGHVLRRVMYLMFLGFIVNFLRSVGLSHLNVLHTIGFSILLVSLVYVSGSRFAYPLTLAVLVLYSLASPWLEANPHCLLDWIMASGEYPLGESMVYFMVGLGMGLYSHGLYVFSGRLAYAAHALLLSSLLLLLFYPLSFSVNSPPYLFFALASMTYLLLLLERSSRSSALLAVFGRHALQIYVTAHALFIFAPSVAGVADAVNASGLALLFTGFLAGEYAFIRWFEAR